MQQLAKPSRTLPSTSKGLSEASPAGRPVAASLWPVRSLPPLFLWASKATFRHFGPPSKAFRPLAASLWPVRSFSAAGRPLAASLWPVRSLPPLFLWASKGNVRHFGPASKASRQPAGLLRPLCGLSEACLLSSYGLPKATLGILDRLQKPLGSRQASCGLSVACPKPASSLLMGFRRQRYRHFGPASKASRQPAGLLRPLCGLSEACLLSSYRLPKATLGILARLQTLPSLSEACLLSSYGLPKATLGIFDQLQKPLGSRQASCGLSVACPKPASSLLTGFRRQR